MIQSIVVPSDFSENSRIAVEYAAALRERFHCSLYVVHAYQPFRSGFQSEEANEKERLKAEASAQAQMEDFRTRLTGRAREHLKTVLLPGHLIDALLRWEVEHKADLIVAGTKGASSAGEKLIGSNAFELAQESPVPVVVVPAGTENFNLEQIAFFTDYAKEDATALRETVSLFGTEKSRYQIVHIQEGDPSTINKSRFSTWVKELKEITSIQHLNAELTYGEEEVELVNQISKRGNIDLLALSLNRKSFFERFFQNSFARAIIHQSKTPVLLIRTYGRGQDK